MRALLDVNVLIALLDSAHVHHVDARVWLEGNIASGWASCPLTQNGCLRILSQPGYPGSQPPGASGINRAPALPGTPTNIPKTCISKGSFRYC